MTSITLSPQIVATGVTTSDAPNAKGGETPSAAHGPIERIAVAGVVAVVRAYQFVFRPLRVGVCRFHPSCSEYMIGAVRKHGFIKGVCRGLGRICRCHPWNPGGHDPP